MKVLLDQPHNKSKDKKKTRLLFAKEMAWTASQIYQTQQDEMQIQWCQLSG